MKKKFEHKRNDKEKKQGVFSPWKYWKQNGLLTILWVS